MKKVLSLTLALVLCGALILTGCSGAGSSKPAEAAEASGPNVSGLITGRWISAESNGKSIPTNSKIVLNVVSDTKAYMTAWIETEPGSEPHWISRAETEVVIDGSRISFKAHTEDNYTYTGEYIVTAIDGTYTYYVKDGENWTASANTLNEYFTDGNLLCTRWIDNGKDNREWWEIAIDGNDMNWTALRSGEDSSSFTVTFEMTKIITF